MRIAVYHNQPSGGARRALYELGRQLSQRHQMDVFALETADEAFLNSGDFAREITIFPFRRRPPLRGGLYLNELWQLLDLRDLERLSRVIAARIDSGSYDVALVDACRFVQTPSVLSYLRTPSAYYCHHAPRRFIEAVCRPEAAPLSLYERARALWHRPATKLYDMVTARLDRRNLGNAPVVLTNSEHTRGIIRDYYGRDAAVCRLGVDRERFAPNGGERGDYVLSVGALEPHKGFAFLIRSLGRCPPSLRPGLVIVGNTDNAGVSRHLYPLAARLDVQLQILTGVAPMGEELARLYQRARAFVFAAHQEPFGLVVLEAMACGLPVVSVAEGGPTEIVIDAITGFLVPRDEEAFAGAVMRVLSDPPFAHALGLEGRKRIEAEWTWEVAAQRMEDHLYALASGRRGGAL